MRRKLRVISHYPRCSWSSESLFTRELIFEELSRSEHSPLSRDRVASGRRGEGSRECRQEALIRIAAEQIRTTAHSAAIFEGHILKLCVFGFTTTRAVWGPSNTALSQRQRNWFPRRSRWNGRHRCTLGRRHESRRGCYWSFSTAPA